MVARDYFRKGGSNRVERGRFWRTADGIGGSGSRAVQVGDLFRDVPGEGISPAAYNMLAQDPFRAAGL